MNYVRLMLSASRGRICLTCLCDILVHFISSGSLGYGFVGFEDVADAGRACNGLNGRRLGNKRLKVSRSPPTLACLLDLVV